MMENDPMNRKMKMKKEPKVSASSTVSALKASDSKMRRSSASE